MNFGFNSNVSVGGAVYHVQTEDRGPAHPYLDTVVYESGRVVHKLSAAYGEVVENARPEDLPQLLHDLLAKQHRAVIAQMEAGTLDLATNNNVTRGALNSDSGEGLEVRLLNPKSWLRSGAVTLEVEIRQGNSTEPITEANIESFLETDKDRFAHESKRSDSKGRATLNFPLPETVADGTSLVIRATDGSLYGELRFRLKARQSETVPAEPPK